MSDDPAALLADIRVLLPRLQAVLRAWGHKPGSHAADDAVTWFTEGADKWSEAVSELADYGPHEERMDQIMTAWDARREAA